MGDMYRYYVPPKEDKKEQTEENGVQITVTTRTSVNKGKPKTKLPTPQAFFERQKRLKEDEHRAMMRYATRKTAKHNLHVRTVRYSNLRSAQNEVVDELSVKLHGTTLNKSEKSKKVRPVTEQEYLEKIQAKDMEDNENSKLDPAISGFYLNELEDALEDDDEYKINKSILVAFFEQYSPHRVSEVDTLLKEHKGKELELFQSLADEYKINVKTKSSVSSSKDSTKEKPLETESATESPSTSKDKTSKAEKIENPRISVLKERERAAKAEKKRQNSFSSNKSRGTVGTMSSLVTTTPVSEEMKEFQKALDKEIKGKLYSGEYVLSIVEHGGRWWVNRDVPKVHPSQRRRNTLLDDLRKGNFPIANDHL